MNIKSKYKVIIFDFDNTLSNKNLFLLGIKLKDIDEKNKIIKINNQWINITNIFNDYNKLSKIFIFLKKQNVKLCIASFGSLPIIIKIINICFPKLFDYVITPDNIDDESKQKNMIIFRHIIDSSCSSLYSKNIMIKTIMNKYNIKDPKNILFFDDDSNNSNCSKNILKIHSYNNSKNGITAKLLQSVIFELV